MADRIIPGFRERDLYAVVLALKLSGLVLAALSFAPLRGVADLAPTPQLRRAWLVLAYVIVLCISLRLIAAGFRPPGNVGPSDILDALVYLLGPSFVLA